MSQPVQQFTSNIGYEYSVIDNGAAPTYPTLVAGTHIGYDCTTPVFPFEGGANSQSDNAFKNGNIPDFVKAGSKFTTTAAALMIITYKLPS